MLTLVSFLTTGALFLGLGGSVYGELPKAGKNELTIRAHQQKIDFYAA